eukprot:gnl/TRDRNA2_/TRDRNA2_165384_c0_seq1.p1 gnl/TRDRNA2_/TRDRNA2_165384_c0~~gnl/TRDRNA2_/TRDRNA2_165384_c0_seq1.p1  ORF type:complete len:565 (+),score=59.64 gnl/TRDRNA2_/TRDRNA2_165384_c0_seq1:145-1839(+)
MISFTTNRRRASATQSWLVCLALAAFVGRIGASEAQSSCPEHTAPEAGYLTNSSDFAGLDTVEQEPLSLLQTRAVVAKARNQEQQGETSRSLSRGTSRPSASPVPKCVGREDDLPRAWRPLPETLRKIRKILPTDSGDSLTVVEDACLSTFDALDNFYRDFPQHIDDVGWSDAFETIRNYLFGKNTTTSMGRIQIKGMQTALKMLMPHVREWTAKGPDHLSPSCKDSEELISVVTYAHQLLNRPLALPAGEAGQQIAGMLAELKRVLPSLVTLHNKAQQNCESLDEYIRCPKCRHWLENFDLKNLNASASEFLFDMVTTLPDVVQLQAVPGIEIPSGSSRLISDVWDFVQKYPYRDSVFTTTHGKELPNDSELFHDDAYLATHVLYLPTGNQRHPLYVDDAPLIIQFLRRNFYAALEFSILDKNGGDTDLVSEFLDNFRQLGCTEENDVHVRHGIAWLLDVNNNKNKGKWIRYNPKRKCRHRLRRRRKHKEDKEDEAEIGRRSRNDCEDQEDENMNKKDDDYFYELIHEPWTSASAFCPRAMQWEPVQPDNYGGLVRKLMHRDN